MTSIMIADDHEMVRRGLHSLLTVDPTFKIIGEACDGLAAVQMLEKLKPDILFLDLAMERLPGLEVLKQAAILSPKTRTIILTMHTDEPYVVEALRAGAAGYLLKGSSSQEILHALREVLAGRRTLSAPLSEWAINVLTSKGLDTSDPLTSLTAREREVMQLAAEGFVTAEIAQKLFISPRTCESHRANLMRKLGLQTQTDLVRFAIRKGMIHA